MKTSAPPAPGLGKALPSVQNSTSGGESEGAEAALSEARTVGAVVLWGSSNGQWVPVGMV